MTADPDGPITVAFVCVENAGRSQMAAAIAEGAVEERGVGDQVRVRSGGTDPADSVHDVVVEAMCEAGVDLTDRTPRELSGDELLHADVVITMGCSAADVCPATWRGDARDWALDDPAGQPLEVVRELRDEIEKRVQALLGEVTANRIEE